MTYAVIDLETTIASSFKRKANPFDPMNHIVAAGIKVQGHDNARVIHEDRGIEAYFLPYFAECYDQDTFRRIDPPTTIVGHNIKFDLLYLWKYSKFQDWLKAGGKVWDTQLAEYMLTGQQTTMCGLRDIAVNKYGCKEREKRMEVFWDAGVCTSEIPKEIVLEDLKYDLLDTEQVFIQQIRQAHKEGMLPLIKSQMEDLLATTEMEFNGLYVDKEICKRDKAEIEKQIQDKKQELDNLARQYWDIPFELNWDSGDHRSGLFFGSKIKWKEKLPLLDNNNKEVLFKSGVNKGCVKTKWTEVSKCLPKLANPLEKWALKKEGLYCTDEDVLSALSGKDNDAGKIAKLLLEWRGLCKQLRTYYESIDNLVNPVDSCIHHQLHHCVTVTGRLSSTNPNMQNIPSANESLVKKIFRSRYGDDGVVVEADFSQIEIVAQAWLAQDENMINDITNGVDFHCKRLAFKERMDYDEVVRKVKVDKDPVWVDKRKKIKTVSFQRSYGAGVKKISEETGLSEQEVQAIIKAEEELYPNIKIFNEATTYAVESNKKYLGHTTDKGYSAHVSVIPSITGRKYSFVERDAPDFLVQKGKMTSFKPTEIKNYPVQGLATADIVPIMVGKLFSKLIHHRDKCVMINTIHDSVMLDVRKEHEEYVTHLVKSYLEMVREVMKEIFNLNFNVPIKVETKSGSSWWDCEKGE